MEKYGSKEMDNWLNAYRYKNIAFKPFQLLHVIIVHMITSSSSPFFLLLSNFSVRVSQGEPK